MLDASNAFEFATTISWFNASDKDVVKFVTPCALFSITINLDKTADTLVAKSTTSALKNVLKFPEY